MSKLHVNLLVVFEDFLHLLNRIGAWPISDISRADQAPDDFSHDALAVQRSVFLEFKTFISTADIQLFWKGACLTAQ